jgi:hypothetical protein
MATEAKPAAGRKPARAAAKASGRKATPAKAAGAKSSAKAAKSDAKPAAKRAPRKQAAPRYQVDDRLKTMSPEALTCRAWGHAPFRAPVPPALRLSHRERGQKVVIFGCRNHCGRVRTIVLEAGTMAVISDKTKYEDPKTYLVQTVGAGRVPRQHSRQAFVQLVDSDD